MSVGFPEILKLAEFGSHVKSAFDPPKEWANYGCGVYQVGSSVGDENKRGWYDVDVVCIVDDELWQRMGFRENPDDCQHRDAKWIAMCLAFSALGREMTGLRIDFKIQPQTWANEKHKGKPRNAIYFVPHRFTED